MRPVFTFSQLREAEKNIIEKDGVPSLLLMENAGKNAFDILSVRYPDIEDHTICIFCGKGNNAGDGFVLARHMAINKIDVNIVHVSEISSLKGDALLNYELLHKLKSEHVNFISYYDLVSGFAEPLRKGKVLIVDAILGTGVTGMLSAEFEHVIEYINTARKRNKRLQIAAIDVPSGLMSGEQINPVINADITITMAAVKTEMLYGAGRENCGEIYAAPIGISERMLEQAGNYTGRIIDHGDISKIIPKRKKSSYKYSNGKPLLIGGSKGMSGALIMSTLAAIKSGSGGVNIGFPESLGKHYSSKLFDVIKTELDETAEQTISADAYHQLIKKIAKADAVLIGPGISLNDETKTFVTDVIANCDKPLVIDADALTILSENINVLLNRKSKDVILTPHMGEFSRLSGLPYEEIISYRFQSVCEFAVKYNVNVVMKSESTFTCLANGEIYFNSIGNEALAVAGSGDVLAGIIVSLLAQSGNVRTSALCGIYLHGMLADMYFEKYGNKQSASQKELISFIPKAVTELLDGRSD